MLTQRRHFLKQAAFVTTGFASLRGLFGSVNNEFFEANGRLIQGYGELRKDPEGILDLPPNFSYRIVTTKGSEMSDGFFTPGMPDGMAAFPDPDGSTILLCNHEMDDERIQHGEFFGGSPDLIEKIDPSLFFDAGTKGNKPCSGAVTRIKFDTQTQKTIGAEMALAGTLRNCAGGPTPHGTWITCEESVQKRDGRHRQDHGYAFEVGAKFGSGIDQPIPLKGMGRFNHEAVAIDPTSGIVYLTEDRHDSLIYRFIPEKPNKLAGPGKLQALVVTDAPCFDTRNWDQKNGLPVGKVLNVRWIDMHNIDAPEDDLRFQGFDRGAARFARGEGMWYGNDAVYFACTNGGHKQKGQIFRYVPSRFEGRAEELKFPGRLELFSEPNDADILEMADNLTVAPWGDLILSEDGENEQFIVGITKRGDLYKLARNAISDSEFAGSVFSPDGSTLFCNIQGDGLTLAIQGPWRQ